MTLKTLVLIPFTTDHLEDAYPNGVYFKGCDFTEIHGNYYDGSEQAEYTRLGAGQSTQTSQSISGPGHPPPGTRNNYHIGNTYGGDGGHPAVRNADGGSDAALDGNIANSQLPFNSQNYPFGSSPYGFTTGAVDDHPPAFTRTPQGLPRLRGRHHPRLMAVFPNFAESAPPNSGKVLDDLEESERHAVLMRDIGELEERLANLTWLMERTV
ncbi:hypothetical protein AX14_012677 [Amanita brunnescens Koide BX004]|nr:hypothetical protein AX14_012677 [Amanita brunnescens Koide BX004]